MPSRFRSRARSGGVALQHRLAALLNDGNTIAYYDMSRGVTGASYASEVANQIPLANQPHGDAGSLLQATGSAQPWHLPFAGRKYLANFGVSGNYLSTPDSVASSITGDIDIRVKLAMNDWTPAAATVIFSKDDTAANRDILFYFPGSSNGLLQLFTSADGTTLRSAASTAATGFTDGTTHWVRATRVAATGTTTFYTSEDGVNWSQLGNTVATTAGNIHDGTSEVRLCANTTNYLSGKIYEAQVYNGIAGTLAVNFNAEDSAETSTNGATFVSSTTGETWTLNNTGALKAQIVGSASLLFDGTAQFMNAAAFTSAQPTAVFLDMRQVTFTSGDRLMDGNTALSMMIDQGVSSGDTRIYAGGFVGPVTATLNKRDITQAIYNGASSSIAINNNTPSTGNAGAGNAGGFYLGRSPASTLGNIQVSRVIIRNSTANADAIRRLLMAISGTA